MKTPNLKWNLWFLGFVDALISPTYKEGLDFFSNLLFLSLPELEPIKTLFQKLRPSFKLPSWKVLSTTLLDKVYDNTKNEVNSLIDSTNYVCLISDGW